MRYVAGADEAGRGCLAGPLVAAAVLFDLERVGPREVRALSDLNDSKQQLPETRAEHHWERILDTAGPPEPGKPLIGGEKYGIQGRSLVYE